MVEELFKFARKVEPLAFKIDKKWYDEYTYKFVSFYNVEQQEEIYNIVKKINDYVDINDLYDSAKPLFIIWSSSLCYYIENHYN